VPTPTPTATVTPTSTMTPTATDTATVWCKEGGLPEGGAVWFERTDNHHGC
jgi:hypothetical protein